MKISPEVAANYVRFIKKNLEPNPFDKFDVIDFHGNKVNLFFNELERIAKQSKFEFERKELRSQANWINYEAREATKEHKILLESLQGIREEINNRIESLEESIKRIQEQRIVKPRYKHLK